MHIPTPPPSIRKRKRPLTSTTNSESSSPSRLRTAELPSPPCLDGGPVVEGSPRTAVAGHLQTLDLEEPPSAFSSASDMDHRAVNASAPPSTVSFEPHHSVPPGQHCASRPPDPITPPSSSHAQDSPSLEIPETPHLRPTTPASSAPDPPPSALPAATTPPSKPLIVSPMPHHPNTLWWSDTEITGHHASDPTDDGYGINGVGFVPTPAMASVRAEKRKRQVREWKEREAREARAKRGERRRRARGDLGTPGLSPIAHPTPRRGEAGDGVEQEMRAFMAKGKAADQDRRVRFLEV